ncbi:MULTISPECIES: MinD/ParA family ATP-binding protein [Clostridium]|uniref:MinD/ParA family ATP-binding protein n=1 Tax=Clostridium TaxID=1485 RepID=UPI000825AC9F|nr:MULTISPECIES: hypothetical protein [Clostridium]PJI10078.1 hypothetical protein CUB90_20360 [Clostridium sp. CT7]
MKIGVATGMTELDEKVSKMLENTKDMKVVVVNYREFFLKENFDVVVLSRRLTGEMDINDVLFLVKSKNTRIVYLTNEDDTAGVKRCFNYSINDILFDPVKPEDVIKLILKPNSFSDISSIYLKYSNLENDEKASQLKKQKVIEKKVKVPVKEIIYKTKILRKNVIAVYSVEDSLLTADFITQIGVILSKKSNQKILILDFNTLFPTVDDFFGIKKEISIQSKYDIKNSTSIELMYNAIERKIFNEDNFTKFVNKHNKYKNIDIATGLYDLMLFEKMPPEYFENIINIASQIYDTVLINTNPDISLGSTFVPIKLSTKIICIVRPNYTSIRNMLFVIDNLKKAVSLSKFNIVISELSNNSLDIETIEKLFEKYKIIGYLPHDSRKEEALNNQKPFIDTLGLKSQCIKPYMEVLKNLGYIPKASILDRFFIGKKGVI